MLVEEREKKRIPDSDVNHLYLRGLFLDLNKSLSKGTCIKGGGQQTDKILIVLHVIHKKMVNNCWTFLF